MIPDLTPELLTDLAKRIAEMDNETRYDFKTLVQYLLHPKSSHDIIPTIKFLHEILQNKPQAFTRWVEGKK